MNTYLTVNDLRAKLDTIVREEPAVGSCLVEVAVLSEGAGGIASRVTLSRNTADYGDMVSITAERYAIGNERAGEPDDFKDTD